MMKLAIGLTRTWVRLYTKGLPPEQREARRAEIDSDLWEQGYDGEANGNDPQETGLQVLLRLLAGVPEDLTWRLEQVGARRGKSATALGRSESMSNGVLQKGLIGLTVLAAALYVAGGLGFVIGYASGSLDWSPEAWEVAIFGGVPFAAAALVAVGLLIGKLAPWQGVALVSLGVVAMAAAWFWLFFITIPIGLLIIGSAVLRARRFSRERDRMAAA